MQDGTCTVRAGGVRPLGTSLQVEAIIACTLVHSVFNINFPRKTKALLLILKVMLRGQPSSRMRSVKASGNQT